MHLLIFGLLITIGVLWQAVLVQKLLAKRELWSTHLSGWPQHVAFPFFVLVWSKLPSASFLQSMAIPTLLYYLGPMFEAITSIGKRDLRENACFSVSVIIPCILGSIIALGASMQAIFVWYSAADSTMANFSSVNVAVLNALAFGLLFQAKALLSPLVVCVNLAWSGFVYVTTGKVEVWSAMENLLQLVLEPAAAVSAAPWYVALMFVLAVGSTFGDALESAAGLQ
jgi:hypothetical protein